MDNSSNTAFNNKVRGKPFEKGDPRINRRGRPRYFDILREIANKIAEEEVTSKDGKLTMKRAEMILRSWATSKNHQLQIKFMEIAYGKVPDEIDMDITSLGETIRVVGINVDEL